MKYRSLEPLPFRTLMSAKSEVRLLATCIMRRVNLYPSDMDLHSGVPEDGHGWPGLGFLMEGVLAVPGLLLGESVTLL